MRLTDRQSLEKWDAHRKAIERSTDVPIEDEATRAARKKRLANDFEAFSKYYFPNYASAPFAKFQLKFAKKVIASDNIYIVRAWAREHAKSVVSGLFLPMFLKFTGRLSNMLLVSHSYDNACELLMPIMLNLESNQRIIADYGVQKGFRGWEMGRFLTNDAHTFMRW